MTPLIRQLLTVLNEHTRQTGLRLTPGFFELRVHPEDLDNHFIEASEQWMPFTFAREIAGIPIIRDHRVPEGHPELACTWRMTL